LRVGAGRSSIEAAGGFPWPGGEALGLFARGGDEFGRLAGGGGNAGEGEEDGSEELDGGGIREVFTGVEGARALRAMAQAWAGSS
jgi:hypothetical protein